ncbi:TIGR03564 family F420-dependent LLM class oxidoreductase [Allokutzneria multivorans]|uniref:TIGR03564 family F420-dependent LLM class oxidoreductase n=1 Tax=Allokutzneria multivorans TaxID=1142134 RepID=UPI0031E5816D
MTIGVILDAAGPNAVDDLVAQGRAAKDYGLGSAWFAQRFDVDAIGVAGLIGREVPGLRVGTSAVPIFARHPILVASQAATAQAATHGRFSLGVGLGAKGLVEPTFGIGYDRPIAQLREFLTATRQALETGSAEVRGETLTAVTPWPSPVAGAQPAPQILVAAMGPQALRATGELADGTLPFLAGPRALGEHIVPTITAASSTAPRIVALVPTIITDEVDEARSRLAENLAFYDGIPSYQKVIERSGVEKAVDLALIGDEVSVAAAIRGYFDAGATEVVLSQTALGGEAARERTWRFGGELARSISA